MNEIEKRIEEFSNKNKEELNSIIFELNSLFSKYNLKKLVDLYDIGFNSSLSDLNNYIDK